MTYAAATGIIFCVAGGVLGASTPHTDLALMLILGALPAYMIIGILTDWREC